MPSLANMRSKAKEAGLMKLDKLIEKRQHIPTNEFPIPVKELCERGEVRDSRDRAQGKRRELHLIRLHIIPFHKILSAPFSLYLFLFSLYPSPFSHPSIKNTRLYR